MTPKPTIVADWMSRHPLSVSADLSVLAAYERMRVNNIRHLAVTQDTRLIGVITRSDIEQAMPPAHDEAARLAARSDLAGMIVAQLMSAQPHTATPAMSVGTAAAIMLRHRIGSLPVVENGRLVGILTESDILRLVAETYAGAQA
jgi:acetoin utilization protein AcuB